MAVQGPHTPWIASFLAMTKRVSWRLPRFCNCEERSDVAIAMTPLLVTARSEATWQSRGHGLPRFARNDGRTRHFQAALRRIWAGL